MNKNCVGNKFEAFSFTFNRLHKYPFGSERDTKLGKNFCFDTPKAQEPKMERNLKSKQDALVPRKKNNYLANPRT